MKGLALALAITVTVPAPEIRAAELQKATLEAWHEYVRLTERRIEAELASPDAFLTLDALTPADAARERAALLAGAITIGRHETKTDAGTEIPVPAGLIHHWTGRMFIPDVTLDEVLDWARRYDDHAPYFEEVLVSDLLSRQGDTFTVFLKLRRRKIVTVTYHTVHRVEYRRADPGRASSRSVATKIAELADAGGPAEREKPEGRDSGFLWRLQSYWRFAARDAGVMVECESLSLSRDVPALLKWLIRGQVESVSRESLQNTLGGFRTGLRATRSSASSRAPRSISPVSRLSRPGRAGPRYRSALGLAEPARSRS